MAFCSRKSYILSSKIMFFPIILVLGEQKCEKIVMIIYISCE